MEEGNIDNRVRVVGEAADYWRERCLAAEAFIEHALENMSVDQLKKYHEWVEKR